MIEYVPSIFVGIATIAVAIMTYHLWKATGEVANATSEVAKMTHETAKLPYAPRISIVKHTNVGEDKEHDWYEFTFKNDGLGDAFDFQIEIFRQGGSTESPPVRIFQKERIYNYKDMNVKKGTKTVRFKIKFYDLHYNFYEESFDYDIKSDEYSPKIDRNTND